MYYSEIILRYGIILFMVVLYGALILYNFCRIFQLISYNRNHEVYNYNTIVIGSYFILLPHTEIF